MPDAGNTGFIRIPCGVDAVLQCLLDFRQSRRQPGLQVAGGVLLYPEEQTVGGKLRKMLFLDHFEILVIQEAVKLILQCFRHLVYKVFNGSNCPLLEFAVRFLDILPDTAI